MITKKYRIDKSGIIVFSSDVPANHKDYNSAGLDRLYESEEKHFWFLARKQKIKSIFARYIEKSDFIMEIGAGTGNVSLALQTEGYNISVGEMHYNGLKYARSYGIKNCYQFDLLSPPFAEHFDTIGMFDVLTLLSDDIAAMKGLYSMLAPGGKVVLTVPAHQWLWNRTDAVGGNKRRYNIKQLKKVLQSAGFKVLCAEYFFIFIIPLFLLRRFVNKDDGSPVKPEEYNVKISINPTINSILLKISQLENKISSWIPNLFGGSIIVVARKE